MILHYERKLGDGGYGQVWLAEDLQLRRLYAVKFFDKLPPERANADASLHAQALVRAEHRAVVRVYSLEEQPHPVTGIVDLAIIMEFVDGMVLRDNRSPIETQHAHAIVRDLIDAVEAIHVKELTHSDLHDGNVLITSTGAKVIDILHWRSLADLGSKTVAKTRKEDVRDLAGLVRQVLERMPNVNAPMLSEAYYEASTSAGSVADLRRAYGRLVPAISDASSLTAVAVPQVDLPNLESYPNPLTIQQIENAFVPAREITEPARFAGRREQVEQSYLSLVSAGTNLALIGNRGVGKSSLARQLVRLATGDLDLVRKHGLIVDRKLDFIAMYHACGNSVTTTEQLLEQLLLSQECLSPWIQDVPDAKRAMEGYSPHFLATSRSLAQPDRELQDAPSRFGDTPFVFTNVVSAIVKASVATDGILFVVDEFDQIAHPSGFASFLKSLATNVPEVKFGIVGVAHDLRDLMNEHQSSDRLFAGGVVQLPSMTAGELTEVIDLAESQISRAITFHPEAKQRLVDLAQGHPYMVHLIGKHALRAAWRAKEAQVSAARVEATLNAMATSGADPVLEGRYKKAITSSPQREAVLRAMAEAERNGEVWTTDAYQKAVAAGVENPSQYVGNLVIDEYGAELIKVRERYYRFKDSLFRAYVCARPPQYVIRQ